MERTERRRRRNLIIAIVTAVVVIVPVLAVGAFWVSWQGGPEAIWLNAQPAPDQDKPSVVEARQKARDHTRAELESAFGAASVVPGRETYAAQCRRGQNNWKVHEGYVHTCTVTSGRFYGLRGDFPAAAKKLHAELGKTGWEPWLDDGLPGIAKQYKAGYPPYETPTPGAPSSPVDFEQFGWDTSYGDDDKRIQLRFANKYTDDFHSFDWAQDKVPYETSWSDLSGTVSSADAVAELLATCDVVVLATIEEEY
ncbi:MAG: hypothetical protein LCH96_11410 [Actinobacteria bacterium]|nr:hypothetical protein [Actinomycetota bacterium]